MTRFNEKSTEIWRAMQIKYKRLNVIFHLYNLDIFERWNVNPVTNYFSVKVSHLLSIKRALKSGREILLASLYEVFLTRNCSTWNRKEREKTGEKQIKKKVREERKVYEKCVSYSSWHCLEHKSLAS